MELFHFSKRHKCAVKFCQSDGSVDLVGFSRKRAKEWKKLCGLPISEPTVNRKVCVKHFERSDFYQRSSVGVRKFEVKDGVDPKLNLPSPEIIA